MYNVYVATKSFAGLVSQKLKDRNILKRILTAEILMEFSN
jgi:hypothetical protein